MMTIKAKIHAAGEATEVAHIRLAAATAHLSGGSLEDVRSQLDLAAQALERAQALVRAAATRASDPSSAESAPADAAASRAARRDGSARMQAARDSRDRRVVPAARTPRAASARHPRDPFDSPREC